MNKAKRQKSKGKKQKLLLAGLMYGLKILSPCFITLQTFNSFAQTNGVGAGNCLQFDGVDDYIEIPYHSSLVLTQDATYEAWINIASATGGKYIFINLINPDSWGMLLSISGGKPSTAVIVGSQYTLAADDSIQTGKWYHIAGVRQGTSLLLYVNGKLVKQMSVPSGNLRTGSNRTSRIGMAQNGVGNFHGSIDEVRVWNKALSEQEIQQHTCSKLAGNETGLMAYWNFDNDSGSVAYDSSPNANHGKLTNMDTVSTYIVSGANIQNSKTVDISTDTTFCTGSVLTLNAGSDFTSYLWQDSTTSSALAVIKAGTYWVTATDSSCFISSSDTVTVTEHALPFVSLGKDTVLCQGQSVVLDAGAGYSYAWSTGTNTQTINVNSSNTYSIIVTDSNGCSNSDTIIVTTKICTAINDQQQASSTQFQVYPNPSDGNFEISINYTELKVEILQLVIYDVLGKSVYQQTINTKQQILNTKLNKGIYFLQVISDDGIWNEKVIVNY